MIPCCNEEVIRFKCSLVNESGLYQISSSVSQCFVHCISIPYLASSSRVHICPVRGNQWKTIQWKGTRRVSTNRPIERYISIVVHLSKIREKEHLKCGALQFFLSNDTTMNCIGVWVDQRIVGASKSPTVAEYIPFYTTLSMCGCSLVSFTFSQQKQCNNYCAQGNNYTQF